MHRPNPRQIIPILILIVLAGVAWYYFAGPGQAKAAALTASGTVEAVEVHVGTQLGGRVEAVNVAEGEAVQLGQIVATVRPTSGAVTEEVIRSPLNGVVLERLLEPGELATPNGTLLVVGDLHTLNLTVYVGEDHYGQIYLKHSYAIVVDSYPGRVFSGTVTHIANQAEFTPRNVQTVEGRKNTVYAIRLSLFNPDLALKPGMPADVNFEVK